MTRSRTAIAAVLAAVAAATVWVLFAGLPRWVGRSRAGPAAASSPLAPAPGRKIKASLFYVSEDGQRLTRVERDVAFGEGTVEQARQIVEAQIAPVAEPLVSAIPEGTKLRTIFVTSRGDAFVDLSGEVSSKHPGGSFTELLTVYAIVNAVTANLPTIQRVQILIDGKEAETLAGHVDLRRPLVRDVTLVRESET